MVLTRWFSVVVLAFVVESVPGKRFVPSFTLVYVKSMSILKLGHDVSGGRRFPHFHNVVAENFLLFSGDNFKNLVWIQVPDAAVFAYCDSHHNRIILWRLANQGWIECFETETVAKEDCTNLLRFIQMR